MILIPGFVKVVEHFSDSTIIDILNTLQLFVLLANGCQYDRARGAGILSSLLSRTSEARSHQTVINGSVADGDKRLKIENGDRQPRKTAQEPCGHQCKLIKQVTMINSCAVLFLTMNEEFATCRTLHLFCPKWNLKTSLKFSGYHEMSPVKCFHLFQDKYCARELAPAQCSQVTNSRCLSWLPPDTGEQSGLGW